jgi:hypothetical protein
VDFAFIFEDERLLSNEYLPSISYPKPVPTLTFAAAGVNKAASERAETRTRAALSRRVLVPVPAGLMAVARDRTEVKT